MSSAFGKVYPFTTEEIAKYFPSLELEGKTILTVGSSGDQALNAMIHGADKIILYDINPNTLEFFKLKRDIILSSNRKEAYKKVLEISSIPFSGDVFSYNDLTSMNTYLKNDSNYKQLQERLKESTIEFICGDIFDFNSSLKGEKFDRIIFSNILQYLDIFAKEAGYQGREYEFLKTNFLKWDEHLNKDGILQLLYYYGFGRNYLTNTKKPYTTMNLPKVYETLSEFDLYLETFSGYKESGQDAIVMYRK